MLDVRDLVANPLNDRSKDTKYARRTAKIQIYFILIVMLLLNVGQKIFMHGLCDPTSFY